MYSTCIHVHRILTAKHDMLQFTHSLLKEVYDIILYIVLYTHKCMANYKKSLAQH